MKTCFDAMAHDPLCCLPTDTVHQAARLMRHENVSALPVVADHKTRKLLGIITDRDLVLKVVAEGRDIRETKVGFVMTKNPRFCVPEDSLQKAFTIMARHQVLLIPVVDEDDGVVGLIDVAAQAGIRLPIFRGSNRPYRPISYSAID